ncbi:hypothetical protein KIW84_053039 [Lathyrus oleraceus]|uniref:Arabidopsis retrotransposon Orf1 C-terminal domain-containing protein n=1 Tax=Pisum sativum TaxID=3888 RepID=A0A9D4WS21_PEA|nr:hypothetical protein KIW84_053039 [Pisum sativum]
MGITFVEGVVGENQRSSYHKLFKRNLLAIRYPDNATLRDLGIFDSVNWMLNNLDMSYFCSLTSPTYIRITYEFLSSFRYVTPVGGSRTIYTIYFRMFNRDYTFSQDHMANIFSFPHGDEYTFQAPLEREWESNALDFWRDECMEQDAPHTRTHAHTTHAFSNSFASTSSGYQPHEEYDYTTMRITLDDILSELRHQNDIYMDCYVLLRTIQRQQEEMRVTIN